MSLPRHERAGRRMWEPPPPAPPAQLLRIEQKEQGLIDQMDLRRFACQARPGGALPGRPPASTLPAARNTPQDYHYPQWCVKYVRFGHSGRAGTHT